MTRADIVLVRAIVSSSYIQSKTWIFATEADRQRFDRAVALLPDLDWAAEEHHARPLDRLFFQALGLPGSNWLGRVLHARSKYRLVRRYAGNYGQIVLACVLAMSTSEHPIMTLRDTEAGARIVSYLPMNWWTWTGNLSLDIHAEDDQLITVEGYSLIPGQVFDWFRGRRELNRVVREVQKYLAAMGAAGA